MSGVDGCPVGTIGLPVATHCASNSFVNGRAERIANEHWHSGADIHRDTYCFGDPSSNTHADGFRDSYACAAACAGGAARL